MKKTFIILVSLFLLFIAGCQSKDEQIKKETTEIITKQTEALTKGDFKTSSDYIYFKNDKNKEQYLQEAKTSFNQLQSANGSITIGDSLYFRQSKNLAISLIEVTYEYNDLSFRDVTDALFIKKDDQWKMVLKEDLTKEEKETAEKLITTLTNDIQEDEKIMDKLSTFQKEQEKVNKKLLENSSTEGLIEEK